MNVIKDITYCINRDCPFKDCERHLDNVKDCSGYIRVAALDGVCTRYIGHLVEEFEKNG